MNWVKNTRDEEQNSEACENLSSKNVLSHDLTLLQYKLFRICETY